MGLIILCDFDGTITELDTLEYLLGKFAVEDWKGVENEYELGRISLEESMQRQMSMLQISKKTIIEELERVISFRSGFDEILEYSRRKQISFVILSAGLDFIIRHFLTSRGWIEFVEIQALKIKLDNDRIKLTFPEILDVKSNDFKEDKVRNYKRKGFKVIYIGNGLSDFNASKNSDFAFSVKDSKLSQLCKKNRVAHKEISSFQEVIEAIEHLEF